jgi:broad-specificity NMP kinase
VLLTGMSGTGKSGVIEALAARGFKAVDSDNGWCEPGELSRVLDDLDAIESRLRAAAHHEIQTTMPLGEVVAEVLRLTGA